ncbi:hypothetical protein Taro_030478 [Colocasia esculenta]|uniref:Protein kinase domain-containing protein n=1 Tax=Colocasia esculenta TaxID=4460 RepID=A0A843W0C4_COLES|nr:hypothetical protein [Colocasia esculenta]
MLRVVLPLVLFAGVLCLALFWCWKNKAEMIKGRWKNRKKTREVASVAKLSFSGHAQGEFSGSRDLLGDEETDGKELDLPMFSFEAIATATYNFSDSNKLGQGGFGDVYRGVLPGGEKVAVKRLSRSSGQGLDEFKTELVLIAKLQHRNLVRLLGCCIQGEEKILIYEYMPNKSLDYFLFDPERQTMLDWSRRFDIIEGVARGLLYLHRDSRVRVVHRDLKASNILLDGEMNPKISDFGMARIFGGNQNADSTNRVVGTFGYMSPEYAMEGLFSVKSDVYSFGVLMLEIVSGRRNNRCGLMNINLLRHAWQLWTAGRAEEIVDPCIRGSSSMQQVLRCIQIGLLCVQDHAHERPTMSSVVIMLCSDAGVNQVPKQPTFTVEGSPSETDSLKVEHDGNGHSINTVTISIVDGR